MAYIDCDKCYHGRVCAYRHHYHDMIVECNHHIPAAGVVEVKHGKWVEVAENSTGKIMACTNCKSHINPNKKDVAMNRASERPGYCPHCGAKMDGRSDT